MDRPVSSSWASQDNYHCTSLRLIIFIQRLSLFFRLHSFLLCPLSFTLQQFRPSANCTWFFYMFAPKLCSQSNAAVLTFIHFYNFFTWGSIWRLRRCWCLITLQKSIQNPVYTFISTDSFYSHLKINFCCTILIAEPFTQLVKVCRYLGAPEGHSSLPCSCFVLINIHNPRCNVKLLLHQGSSLKHLPLKHQHVIFIVVLFTLEQTWLFNKLVSSWIIN